MEVAVLDNFTAVDFLADGNGVYHKTILLSDVSWEQYEEFLKDFEERAGWRLAYDEGNLEIMPPLQEHEEPKDIILRLIDRFCMHYEIDLVTRGSTTFRRAGIKKGVEPDTCFYVQSAKQSKTQRNLKPETYPIPDIAVEIDVTHGSLDKFPIYAALNVPELWIYDGRKLSFYQLQGKKYNQSKTSLAFPQLSAAVLTRFLKLSESDGQIVALKSFRRWLDEQK